MRTPSRTTRALVASAALALTATVAAAPPAHGVTSRTTSPYYAPKRIVSLSPTATEILYAIGAGSQVIAVDDDSNYPTKGLPTTRFNALNPNVEQLVALHPTLVVVSYNPNNLEADLKAAGIPVMEQDAPKDLKGTTRQITWLGNATGHYHRSYLVASGDVREIRKDVALIPRHHRAGSAYFELSPPPYIYAAASNTYVGQLLKSLGVSNVADPASNASNGGYPSLSDEFVIAANPKLIFLADTVCCKQSQATVAARPGWSTISAVSHHFVIGLNDDIASRWGPRVSVLMDDLTRAVLRYDRA